MLVTNDQSSLSKKLNILNTYLGNDHEYELEILHNQSCCGYFIIKKKTLFAN